MKTPIEELKLEIFDLLRNRNLLNHVIQKKSQELNELEKGGKDASKQTNGS